MLAKVALVWVPDVSSNFISRRLLKVGHKMLWLVRAGQITYYYYMQIRYKKYWHIMSQSTCVCWQGVLGGRCGSGWRWWIIWGVALSQWWMLTLTLYLILVDWYRWDGVSLCVWHVAHWSLCCPALCERWVVTECLRVWTSTPLAGRVAQHPTVLWLTAQDTPGHTVRTTTHHPSCSCSWLNCTPCYLLV